METIGTRIKLRRRQFQLTQRDIAEHIGISSAAVTQWENDVTSPSGENLLLLSDCLKCYPAWLLTGKGDPDNPSGASGLRSVPLVSQLQLGVWTSIDDIESSAFIETSARVSRTAFAVQVVGPALSVVGPISIPDGSILIIEPEYNSLTDLNNKIVIARLRGSNESTIKRLVLDGPHRYLTSLTPGYHPIEIDDSCQIVGTIKQIIINLD